MNLLFKLIGWGECSDCGKIVKLEDLKDCNIFTSSRSLYTYCDFYRSYSRVRGEDFNLIEFNHRSKVDLHYYLKEDLCSGCRKSELEESRENIVGCLSNDELKAEIKRRNLKFNKKENAETNSDREDL